MVGVPNLFIGGWIEDHFSDAIGQAAREVIGKEVEVSFSIDPVLFRNMRKSQLNSQAAFIEKNADGAIRPGKNGSSPVVGHARRLRGRLDEFVVGATNRLAYSVACSVVENPERDASPVFFHSACGLGKTHLLQGISNSLAETKPAIRWVYASGEEFTNQFLFALREHRLDAFRHRYREIDVLLLDDIQFLANKKATQEEFLHTFNDIQAVGKRVVLASDAHPRMITDLPESLVTRLMSGMVVRIERPDFETRCDILRRRASRTHQVVPEAVIHYIADKIQANVRELEGCLVKLLAFASLMKSPITLETARQALEDHLKQTGRILTVSDIEQARPRLRHHSRRPAYVARVERCAGPQRRHVLWHANTRTSPSRKSGMMGNKNHTTVLLACRRIGQLLHDDAEVSWQSVTGQQVRKLASILKSQEEQLGC